MITLQAPASRGIPISGNTGGGAIMLSPDLFSGGGGMPFGTVNNGMMTTQSMADPTMGHSLNDLNQAILARARRARASGMSENDVQMNIAQDIAEQNNTRQQLAGAPSSFTTGTQQAQKKGNWLTHLLPTIGGTGGALGGAAAGAALGSVVPIIGTGIGGILGGVIGGALGSGGAKAGENAIEHNRISSGIGGEALMGGLGGLLPGAGKVGTSLLERGGANLAERGAASVAERGAVNAGEQAVTGAVGDAADAGVSRIARMGDEMRANARGLEQAGKFFPMENDRITASNVLDQAGLKGSARNQFRNLPAALNKLNTQASAILENAPNKGDALSIAQRFTDAAADHPEFTEPKFQQSLSKLTDNLLGKADQQTGEITAKDLYGFKQDLASRLQSAWKKIDNGTTLTPQESAYMEVWKGIDNEITQLAPAAKQLTKAQSILMQSAPILDKAANPSTKLFNIVPVKAPTQILQSMESGAGRVMQRIGGKAAATGGEVAARGLPRVVAGTAGRQALPRLLLGGYQDPSSSAAGIDPATGQPTGQPAGDPSTAGVPMFTDAQQAQDFTDQLQKSGIDPSGISQAMMAGHAGAGSVTAGADGSPVHAATGNPWNEQDGVGAIPRSAVQKALADDLVATGGKNYNAILTFADYANQTGNYAPTQTNPGGLDTASQKAMLGLEQANNTVDQIEQMFTSAGGGKGRIGGVVGTLMGKVTGSPLNTYQQAAPNMAALISRALGNTGAMSDGDVARAVGSLPKATDSPQQAQAKLAALRQILAANAQSVMQTAAAGSKGGGGAAAIDPSALGLQ
jgi:hypothetical protein